VAIMGPLVDSGPNLEERAIVPAGIINMHILYIIQCGSGTDFSNKTVVRPCGTRDNKQTNKGCVIVALQGCMIVVLQGCVIIVYQGCMIVALQGCVIVVLQGCMIVALKVA
jgi:hypothetical protein